MSQQAAEVEPRTLAPPERRVVEVIAGEPLGAYRLIRARDAGGPPYPRPGQFYMLAAAARWGGGADERPYLPRAFSFARARAGELEFLLEAIGPGTERLGSLEAGEGLALVGPLGVGFNVADTAGVLGGGGIGGGARLGPADEVRAAGGGPPVLPGFPPGAPAAGARPVR